MTYNCYITVYNITTNFTYHMRYKPFFTLHEFSHQPKPETPHEKPLT